MHTVTCGDYFFLPLEIIRWIRVWYHSQLFTGLYTKIKKKCKGEQHMLICSTLQPFTAVCNNCWIWWHSKIVKVILLFFCTVIKNNYQSRIPCVIFSNLQHLEWLLCGMTVKWSPYDIESCTDENYINVVISNIGKL